MKTLVELDLRNAEISSRVPASELSETQNELARTHTHLTAFKKTYQALV
jgi:hypothetical protein